MSMTVDEGVFARLVGAYHGRDIMLFEVARQFAEDASEEYSDPVRFRFVRREGARVELEFLKLEPWQYGESLGGLLGEGPPAQGDSGPPIYLVQEGTQASVTEGREAAQTTEGKVI